MSRELTEEDFDNDEFDPEENEENELAREEEENEEYSPSKRMTDTDTNAESNDTIRGESEESETDSSSEEEDEEEEEIKRYSLRKRSASLNQSTNEKKRLRTSLSAIHKSGLIEDEVEEIDDEDAEDRSDDMESMVGDDEVSEVDDESTKAEEAPKTTPFYLRNNYLYKGDTATKCAVCVKNLERNCVVMDLECKHIVHHDCLEQCFKGKIKCAICNG